VCLQATFEKTKQGDFWHMGTRRMKAHSIAQGQSFGQEGKRSGRITTMKETSENASQCRSQGSHSTNTRHIAYRKTVEWTRCMCLLSEEAWKHLHKGNHGWDMFLEMKRNAEDPAMQECQNRGHRGLEQDEECEVEIYDTQPSTDLQ